MAPYTEGNERLKVLGDSFNKQESLPMNLDVGNLKINRSLEQSNRNLKVCIQALTVLAMYTVQIVSRTNYSLKTTSLEQLLE